MSRSRRLRRIGIRIAGSLLLLIAVVALVVVWVVRGSLPPLDGELRVSGAMAPLELERDDAGQVTVRASSKADLAFGLGFAHAQDRFFQMDLLRRASAGELSMLVGSLAWPADRQARIHGFRAVAEAAFERATPEHRRRLVSYAAGVNAGLASLRHAPFEYHLLRTKPEPWLATDALLVALSMYRDLQDETNRIERVREVLEATLEPAHVEFLWPAANPWEAPIEGEAGADLRAEEIPPAPPVSGANSVDREIGLEAIPRGSNSFAVGGDLTSHGGAILANDMHLGLSLPAVWYRACLVLESPPDSSRVVGATLPGAPAVVVGSNGSIAWGFTNSYGDWLDFVDLEVDPRRSTHYRVGARWEAFGERLELLRAKGGAVDTLRVRTSLWGPVVSQPGDSTTRALRWVAHDPAAVNLGVGDLAECRSLEEAFEVAARSGMPHQNLLVASRDGRVGWTIIGRIPRRMGQDGSVPRRGAPGVQEWQGFREPEAYPRIVRCGDGRLWTANARVLPLEAQRALGDGGYALGARAQQIRDALRARARFDESALLSIQLDDRALFLERWRDLLLSVLDGGRVQHAQADSLRRFVRAWEGRASASSVGYRAVRGWRDLMEGVLGPSMIGPCVEFDSEFFFRALPRRETSVWALVQHRPLAWLPTGYDDWEHCLAAQVDTLLTGWEGDIPLSARRWGSRNEVRLTHPLSGGVPFLSRWLDLPGKELPGDRFMPRVQGPRFGASQRMVVAPGHEESGIFHMPGGQSGHPWSPHYRDLHQAWEVGKPTPLLPGPARHRLQLRPED